MGGGGDEKWRELLGWRWQLACCFNDIARLLTVRLLRLGSEDKIYSKRVQWLGEIKIMWQATRHRVYFLFFLLLFLYIFIIYNKNFIFVFSPRVS